MPEFLERRFDARAKYYFSSISIIGGVFMDIAATLYGSAMIFSIIFPGISIRMVVIISAHYCCIIYHTWWTGFSNKD